MPLPLSVQRFLSRDWKVKSKFANDRSLDITNTSVISDRTRQTILFQHAA